MNFKVRGKVNTKPLKEAKYDPDGDFEEYDMFVFITNLFTRDLKEPEKLPLNPLGRKYKHFEYSSREGDSTYSPFSVDTDSNIVIGALKPEELDDVKEICNLYKFDYSERVAKRSNGAPVYYLTIVVPTYSRGEVPMSVDDYFESIGIPLEQVVSKWYLDNKAKFERDLIGVRESIDNLKRAIDGKEIDPAAALGVTMATAYNDSEDADKEVEKRMEAHKKETGIDYSKPFTGTAKSGETKKVSTPSLKKMHLSESLFEDVKPDESTIKADLQTALRKKGLELNPKECGIDDAVENIMMSNGELTVDEWIKETKRNYPECFKESLSEAYASQEANQIIDTFLDYVDAGIIDTKEALLSLLRWVSIYEAAEFIKVNDYVPDDDLYEGCRKSKSKKSLKEWSEIDDFMDDHYDTYDVACRFLDIEIPDVCSDVLAKLGDRDNAMNLSTASLNNIVKKCRRFYDEMERAAR